MKNSVHPNLKRRLVTELAIVRRKFGNEFRLESTAESYRVSGFIRVESQSLAARVDYPSVYPLTPPEVRLAIQTSQGCPHILGIDNGWVKICWIGTGNAMTGRRRWDPHRHTAATALLAAQRWLAAMLAWQQLGRWPVADAWDPNS